MICPICKKTVRCLTITPKKLREIILFNSLCFKCDAEIRQHNIKKIELLGGFK